MKTDPGEEEVVDVVGPICETGDFFARERGLPTAREGDLLAILDVGAYGMVLASNYNTRPRAAEILVDGKAVKVIRRRETTADQLRTERQLSLPAAVSRKRGLPGPRNPTTPAKQASRPLTS
jgi:diaminopimelate decarboxylase